MNREEFIDIFSQNVRVSGGSRKFFSVLTYTGNDAASLVPASYGPRVLAMPVGEGFRLLMSRNNTIIPKKPKTPGPMSVRATRKAFRNIREVATKNGFRLSDINLSRAGESLVSVTGDSSISSEVYEKYSGDCNALPVYLGFRREECSIGFTMDMKITCQGYIREAGILIFDALQGILSEASIYGELFQSFYSKHDDNWTAGVNPVTIRGSAGGRDKALEDLKNRLPNGLDIRPVHNNGIYFNHNSGLWGEIACLSDSFRVYFMAEADFNLGVELIDALKEVAQT